MEKETDGIRDEALSFLLDQQAGVLATMSAEGAPRARTVYYTCDDSFNIYFITLKNTRKAADLAADSQAAFVVFDTQIPRTIQIEGKVTDLSDTATADPLLTDFVHKLLDHKKYGIPLEHFDPGKLALYRLTPHWVRWGDFTFGEGTDNVLRKIDPLQTDLR